MANCTSPGSMRAANRAPRETPVGCGHFALPGGGKSEEKPAGVRSTAAAALAALWQPTSRPRDTTRLRTGAIIGIAFHTRLARILTMSLALDVVAACDVSTVRTSKRFSGV